jgi:hypothetical protein
MIELGTPAFWAELETNPARLAAEVCTIDLVNMQQTLQQHASLYAWVAATFESASVAVERAEWNVTTLKAHALLEIKATPDPHTNKPKVVDVIKSEADVHPTVQAAMAEYLKAREKKGVLQAMTKALADRRDMLVQLSAKQREEHKSY